MAAIYQVAGTQLALPDYARIDLAYVEQLLPVSPAPQSQFQFKVPGNRIFIPLSIVAVFTTSALVNDRTLFYVAQDALPRNLAITFSPTTQPASTVINYAFNVGLAGAYSTGGTFTAIPLPVMALMPTNSLNLSVIAMTAGDQISGIAVTAIAIPTGPDLVAVQAPHAAQVLV